MLDAITILLCGCAIYWFGTKKARKFRSENRFELSDISSEPIVEKKKRNFAPGTFDEYIGQAKAKSLIKSYINGTTANKKQLPHMLIYGSAGTGKTTLARVLIDHIADNIAPTRKAEIIAKSINNIEQVVEVIRRLDGGYFIIDEVHGLSRDFAEQLYTIMTDGIHDGEDLPPFTLIGCTTEYGEMFEKMEPFVQRFKIRIKLDDYTEEDITKILEQYAKETFPEKLETLRDVYPVIASNCRNTPRNAISYLESACYLDGDVGTALYNYSILKYGYTVDDLKILKYLSSVDKAGIKALCSFIGVGEKNYLQQEGFLFRRGLVGKTMRGRAITEKGKEVLKELEEIYKVA